MYSKIEKEIIADTIVDYLAEKLMACYKDAIYDDLTLDLEKIEDNDSGHWWMVGDIAIEIWERVMGSKCHDAETPVDEQFLFDNLPEMIQFALEQYRQSRMAE